MLLSMDIVEFFQLSSGKWFSQRTSHYPDLKKPESGKSDLQVECLDSADPVVIQLCQNAQVDPALVLSALRSHWNGTIEAQKEKIIGSTILIAIANPETPNAGILLRQSTPQNHLLVGSYELGTDEALTLTTTADSYTIAERIWFASPNLRLRTSTLKASDGSNVASFSSEIRMGGAKPQT
jgi:CpeS-like protein